VLVWLIRRWLVVMSSFCNRRWGGFLYRSLFFSARPIRRADHPCSSYL